MTRINTNINSLIAQNRLERSNVQLQVALTRLSTGLRINTGKDDPAGLIASEALRSDVTSINRAISNTQRANQIIATADSALGQVSLLLNSMRGLIVEAANSGALSDEEIAANQLQIDSSLEAINRIALTTTFQGRKLLDGSLDFITDANNLTQIKDLRIDQANLGTAGQMSVEVVIQNSATQAELTSSGFATANAAATLQFPPRNDSVLGDIRVLAAGRTADVIVEFITDPAVPTDQAQADFDPLSNTLTISANASTATSISKSQIAAAVNLIDGFSAVTDPSTALDPAGDFTLLGSPPPADLLQLGSIEINAANEGWEFNAVTIELQQGTSIAAVFDSNRRTLAVSYVPGVSTLADISAAIDALPEFSAAAVTGAAGLTQPSDSAVTASTGNSGGGVLQADVVFELMGSRGAQVFNFRAGTNIAQIVSAVNLVSDATGVTAEIDSATGDLQLTSLEYGSKAIVALQIIDEGSSGVLRTSLSGQRSQGTNIQATVNGFQAESQGNELSINTSTLTLSMFVDPLTLPGSLEFTIFGGGALFQLGGDVVSNQQARLGIDAITTSSLGGVSGKLYELGSGQAKSLVRDISGAGRVINEVIGKVTGLRGRLGAFQATTLESNTNSLTETVTNLAQAESSIRDADFATETAALTRAQILVQSGTTVLGIANQNPQNVLRLLQQ